MVGTLNNTLPRKHPGDLTWYMGVDHKRDKENGVSQTTYIKTLLERSDISRSSCLPAYASVNLRSVNDDKDAKYEPFNEMMLSVMWIAMETRSDISNAVRAVARNSYDPKETHWKLVRKTF